MSISSSQGIALPLIEFENVTKSFPLHSGQNLLRQTVQAFLRNPRGERFIALNDVSFRLTKGEGLAVVGRNGAGKSTLLTLVAGLSHPDSGRVTVRGRVGALLELGTGLHPDLTGRENLYLNAALLGFTRAETIAVEDRIVEFAELGHFIDEPLRTYSQGMTMRLAFSIAVHAQPEILIIDEVLAVGDARFQKKCQQKIMEMRNAGCTFLFVSHLGGQVQHFCQRALWLDGGKVRLDGDCETVLATYEEFLRGA